MKIYVAFLVLFVLLACVFAGPTANDQPAPKMRKCVPGKTYFDGCNDCQCRPSGVITCTLRACFQQLENGTAIFGEDQQPPEDFWQKD